MKIELTLDTMGADFLARLDQGEAATVADVSARDDTATIIVSDAGALLGYAVFGWDDDGNVTVYAARSMAGFVARAALVGMFGAAQVLGAPLRVHADTIGRGLAMARAMGANVVTHCRDGDGVPVAIMGGPCHVQ